ncbi:hypothetical protein ACR9IA_08075 [Leclercia pneumoniae]
MTVLPTSEKQPKKEVTTLERRVVAGSLFFILVIYGVLLLTQFR